MTPIKDDYIIELDCLHEKGMIVGSGIIGQSFEKSLKSDSTDDLLYNPNKFKRTYGKVIGVPLGYSNKLLYENGKSRKTVKDIHEGFVADMGCTAHFYWSATTDDRLLSKERLYGQIDNNGGIKMRYAYRIPCHRILAFSRQFENGIAITMNDGYILVKPKMQDESEIVSKYGIFIQDSVRPKYLMAVVEKKVPGGSLKRGDIIIYLPNSDLEVEIGGEKYYAMRETDVIAKVDAEGRILKIFGTLAYILPDKPKEKEGSIFIPERSQKIPPEGQVMDIPSDSELSIGDRIMWIGGGVEYGDGLFIDECNVVGVLS